MIKKPLGEILIDANLIDQDQLQEALELQKKKGGRLGEDLITLGYVTDLEIARALSKQMGIPMINLDEVEVKRDIINLIPQDLATRYQVIPIRRKGRKGLIVAVAEPANIQAVDDIRFRTGYDIVAYISPASQIQKALIKYYHADATLPTEVSGDAHVVEETPISANNVPPGKSGEKFMTTIIWDAVQAGASTIHITPFENRISVKYRIAGTINERQSQPIKLKSSIVSYLASAANFDRKNKGIPQTGGFMFKVADQMIKIIVQSLPTFYGEKFTIRLFRPFNESQKLETLGFPKNSWEELSKAINSHYGIIAIASPLNSGITETYYSFLTYYLEKEYNIISIENPIKDHIDGVTQIELEATRGLTYSQILHFLLDEEIEVLGVTDVTETDSLPLIIQSSHSSLVYCVIKASDSLSAIRYLLDSINGSEVISPEALANALLSVVAQRRVRKVCPDCKKKFKITEEKLAAIGVNPKKFGEYPFYKGAGCQKCNGSGYLGQETIYEVLPISKKIKSIISQGMLVRNVYIQAKKEGFRTLKEEALLRLIRGVTSYEEIMKEFYS